MLFQDFHHSSHVGRKLTSVLKSHDNIASVALNVQDIIVDRFPIVKICRIRFPDKRDPQSLRCHLDCRLHAADHSDFFRYYSVLFQDCILDPAAALPRRVKDQSLPVEIFRFEFPVPAARNIFRLLINLVTGRNRHKEFFLKQKLRIHITFYIRSVQDDHIKLSVF